MLPEREVEPVPPRARPAPEVLPNAAGRMERMEAPPPGVLQRVREQAAQRWPPKRAVRRALERAVRRALERAVRLPRLERKPVAPALELAEGPRSG